ncbi:MAG: tRNA (adenosine(37)-N6)-threonylcarbamoyltransferase complex dimerization subunit type 1 TsaB [Lysobacterales bacterium]
MNLLAIETSTETCSVALSFNGEVLERYRHAPRQHAELLLPWVEQLLSDAGIGYTSLDAIAFSRGPGSFTSLRIGIGVVQGLAWASDRPVIPVSSLAATAQTIAGDGVDVALVALDARMNEVFTGVYEINERGIMSPAAAEKVCPPEDVRVPFPARTSGIGNGFDRYEALRALSAQLRGVNADTWPRASAVLQLAQDWLRTNEPLSAELAQPVYLRDNVAKKPVN